jgi:hypothetical protein|tara:strand:- start:92 stop:769 length:678 start_codon:yes stop_codon:yes gene_type:complete
MGYRWTKDRIEDSTIIESRQFDANYANYSSVVNGGFDRENLPEDAITSNSVVGQALGKAQLLNDQTSPESFNFQDSNYGAPYSNENTRGNRITGLIYGEQPVNEGDSYYEIATDTIDCEEGMLHVQWKCSLYMPMYWSHYKAFTTTTVARKRVQFQIRVNGIIAYESPAICQPFFTVNLPVQIPISKGSQRVEVYVKLPARLNESGQQVILQWWGGQLYTHNFYR